MPFWNRTPAFSEDIGSTEIGGEEEGVKPLERSFWAKYVSGCYLDFVLSFLFTGSYTIPKHTSN